MRTVVTVVGARPQFIKAAPVSKALSSVGLRELLVHTGQHYDPNMSDTFFAALGLPAPAYNLGIGSGNHGAQTGRMLEALETVLVQERPALVLVYGDTNSTLAGALSAAKLHVPIAHVEAGLRSFNRRMPEEVNRVLTDHLSTLLFSPTDVAVQNLKAEGIERGVVRTGDVMLDAVMRFRPEIEAAARSLCEALGVERGAYALATVHRAENTDDPSRWREITDGLRRVAAAGTKVVWPVHPRVRRRLDGFDGSGVILTEPLPYFELQALVMHAKVVLTDSGGLQKEAAIHGTQCATLRDETEWVELVDLQVNRLVGANGDAIVAAANQLTPFNRARVHALYGDGRTAESIARHIDVFLAGAG